MEAPGIRLEISLPVKPIEHMNRIRQQIIARIVHRFFNRPVAL